MHDVCVYLWQSADLGRATIPQIFISYLCTHTYLNLLQFKYCIHRSFQAMPTEYPIYECILLLFQSSNLLAKSKLYAIILIKLNEQLITINETSVIVIVDVLKLLRKWSQLVPRKNATRHFINKYLKYYLRRSLNTRLLQ